MSQTVPQQPSRADAARSDAPSEQHPDQPLPDFHPHAPIEREIERSQRASAALAATRALARAAFTDSQLAADDAAADADIDTSGWARTEYAALDHAVAAPDPHDEPPGALTPARNRAGASFNPGIASPHERLFAGASIARSPIRTRGGAQACFHQESRQSPRGDRVAQAAARIEHSLAAGAANYDKPAEMPMLAAPVAAPAGRPRAPAPVRARTAEPLRFALAAGLGAAIVLLGGGMAWKAGWLSRTSPTNASLVTPQVAAQAEAARVLAAGTQEIVVAPPAAGVPAPHTNAEVDAALAAAARAAATPEPAAVAPLAAPATGGRALAPGPVPVTGAAHAPAHGKDGVAAAVAHAQARADSFLATAPAPAESKPAQ